MKTQIRYGVFESNSSSTHSLTICSLKNFEAWKRGELLFHSWNEEFVKPYQLSENDKENARADYLEKKNVFWKDWDNLSEDEKEQWYKQFALKNNLEDRYLETYDKYMNDYDLYTFEEHHTTENGDQIVVFGKYGYDG